MRTLLLVLTVAGALSFSAHTSAQSSGSVRQTTVRVTTDAHGRIASVVILKSTGSPALDRASVAHIKKIWHGPPNASKEVTFEYKVQPKA